MNQLIHLIYASVTTTHFDKDKLEHLLKVARDNNTALYITGMLLLCDGSFFQVIEGHTSTIHRLFESIKNHTRHKGIVTIIEEPIIEEPIVEEPIVEEPIVEEPIVEEPIVEEPIVEEPIVDRTFSDWSMGFANASKEQITTLAGMNDFFNEGQCLVDIKAGRAKKILSAFAKGRWQLS